MNGIFLEFIFLGCIAILGYYLGQLARRMRLPSLVGYMALGILLGPSGFRLFDEEVLKCVSFIVEIALGFVAFTIGTGLSLSSLKRQGASIGAVILGKSLMTFLVVLTAVYALTRNLSMALLLGAIAPASTVAVIQKYRNSRNFATALFTVAGFGNGLAIIFFSVADTFVKHILLYQAAAASASPLSMMVPIQEILLSLVIGGLIGFAFTHIVRGVSNPRNLLVVTFGSVLLTTGLSLWLHLPLVLTNMIAGFVLVNTRYAGLTSKVVEELHAVMPVLFIPFFCIAGASLNLNMLPSLGVVAVVYILGRTVGTLMGVSFGAVLGNAEEKIRKLLGLGILPQAGLAVGFALIAQHEFAAIGAKYGSDHALALSSSIITIIMAAGIFFEIVGPILAKIAFRTGGEIPLMYRRQVNGRTAGVLAENGAERKRKRHRPEWITTQAFAAVIFVGMVLLCLPVSSSAGKWTNPLTALFTSTSATCVTGLSVVDIGSYFSKFGQIVIICLMQVGGLGIMTLGTFLLLFVGRRLTMRDEVVLTDGLGAERVRGLTALLCKVVLFAAVLEFLGAAVLAHRLTGTYGYTPGKAIYYGIFHAVSAFCNAGLSLYADSLVGLRTDKVFVLTIAALIVLGGLGFLVLYDLSSIKFWRRNRLLRGRLSLHSKIVLGATLALIVIGWLGFLILEADNTLAPLDWPNRIVAALFQSVTPRTAGFNVVDMAAVKPPTLFSTIGLMFIGGSPGSTAGGIKTTTALVLLLSVVAMIRGREETEFCGRIITMRVVREALAIFLLGLFCVLFFFGILLLTEHLPSVSTGFSSSEKLLFETISAFGTVGLSTGITPQLSVLGKWCIIPCMFVGRLGPLTIALIVGAKEIRQMIRYPEEEVVVG